MQCKKILDPDTERRQTSPPGRRSSRCLYGNALGCRPLFAPSAATGSKPWKTKSGQQSALASWRSKSCGLIAANCSRSRSILRGISDRQRDRQDNILRDEKEWRIRKAHRVQDPLQRLKSSQHSSRWWICGTVRSLLRRQKREMQDHDTRNDNGDHRSTCAVIAMDETLCSIGPPLVVCFLPSSFIIFHLLSCSLFHLTF